MQATLDGFGFEHVGEAEKKLLASCDA